MTNAAIIFEKKREKYEKKIVMFSRGSL